MDDRYTLTGADRATQNTTPIYRHDIRDVPNHVVAHISKYNLDQRIALVFLIFKKYYTLREACGLIDDGWCDREGHDWGRMDYFSLDCSKTFVNGVRYL